MNDEWVEATLGDCFTLIKAKSDPETVPSTNKYVGLEHLEELNPRIPTNGLIGDVTSQVSEFNAGDTLFGRLRPYLRKVAKADFDGYCSTEILVLRPNAGVVEPGYLHLVASSDIAIEHAVAVSAGSRMPRTSAADLAALPVSLPPLPVQRRIVDLMTHVDAHIANLRTERQSVLDFRVSLLDDLLFSNHTNDARDSHSGPLSDWSETTIGALIEGTDGSLKTGPFGTALKAAEYTESGAPVISVAEVGYGQITIHPKTPRVSNRTMERLPQFVLAVGDVVFARKGSIDRSARISESEEGYFLGSDGIRLRLPAGTDSEFIAYQLSSSRIRNWLKQHAGGSTMPSLSQQVLERLPITVPPVSHQRTVVQTLSSVDRIAGELANECDRLMRFRAGALAGLLSSDLGIPDAYDAVLVQVA